MEITTENYFKLKESGTKRCDIASALGVTEYQLQRLITRNGWAPIKPKVIKDRFFSTLTEESCYWGGFLAADGNVDLKNRVRIMLNYDDTGHLEKFKEAVESTHKISSNTDKYYRSSFEFTCKAMCQDLETNFHIVPCKTDKLKFPQHLTTEQFRHYLRGYFDGDGSVCESFSNKNSITKTLYATFASGCTEFSYSLFNKLKDTLGLSGTIQDFPNKHQIKYCTNDAKVLLSWMYANSTIYLDRKFEKYITLVVEDTRATR